MGNAVQTKKITSVLTLTTLFAVLALTVPSVSFAAPSISGVTDNRADYTNSQISKYSKIEVSFQVDNSTATNNYFPYDAAPPTGITPETGITVNALFSPDNWQTVYTQPAFYYQDFSWEQRNNRDWAYPTGTYSWKARFSPPTAGNWQYRLEATDASGTGQSSDQTFTVADSASKGFIRVSPTDSRYFQYDDGTYFPGLGYNFTPNTTDIESNESNLQTMEQNGIQIARSWLSSWSLFGSQWSPWYSIPQDYDGYLPRSGLEAFDGAFRLKLSYRSTNPNQPSCIDNCSYWKATRFLGWLSPQIAVKPGTTYRINVRYWGQNITGPRNAGYSNYGLVAKVSTNWLDTPHDPSTDPAGIWKSSYGGSTSSWTDLTGTWTAGATTNYLPYFYLTLENVLDPGSGNPAPVVYIDTVSIQEDLGGGQYGPNIVNKPSMGQLQYFDQRNSFAFDKLLALFEKHNVYIRPVILEKDEYIENHIDFSGVLHTDDPTGLFYGSGTTITPVRWYQRAWWRYLQARWGYSPNIHSWELLNEGDPANSNHYALANSLGQYMRQFAPDNHLVSTSNWSSFPATTWASYPFIDFADVHYYQPRSASTELYDTALADYNRSTAYGSLISGVGKPVIRGETGFVESGSSPSIRDLDADTTGVWLHNFLWAQINHGGMLESYWYVGGVDGHVSNSITGNDHRSAFGTYYTFIKDVPLNNGNYQNANAIASDPALRAWGQKDTTDGTAHLWIQNTNHTWKNVVDGVSITPVNATITIPGLSPNISYPVSWWDTYTGTQTSTQSIAADGSGNLVLSVSNLTTDVAVKIGTYTTGVTPTPTVLPGDINGDNSVNILDYTLLSNNFGTNSPSADLNSDGIVNILDYTILSNNFGRTN